MVDTETILVPEVEYRKEEIFQTIKREHGKG